MGSTFRTSTSQDPTAIPLGIRISIYEWGGKGHKPSNNSTAQVLILIALQCPACSRHSLNINGMNKLLRIYVGGGEGQLEKQAELRLRRTLTTIQGWHLALSLKVMDCHCQVVIQEQHDKNVDLEK